MALIECPECGKQISNKSITCINCGYPLQTAQPSQFEIINQDNSSVRGFIAYFKDRNEKNKGYYYIFGNNEENAISIFLKKNPELSVADKHEIRELFESGKFSCPSCKARFTNCEKKIGCVGMIMIFISLGIGLIMIPFLPYHCYCQVCGHKWKA